MFCSLQLPLRSTPTAQISCLWQHRSCSLNSPSSLPYRPRHSSKFPFTSQFTKVFSNVIVCLSSGTDGSVSDCSGSLKEFEVELELLLALLPERMRRRVSQHPEFQHLIEIVMDLGRIPLARFPSGDFVLSGQPVTFQDLHHATAQVGDFADDNRAGISQTLHRISAIRNRKGVIVGLTCRVGRALSGSANMVRDLVEDGGSLLLIGPPGVGKTTIIREVARMLADDYKKRVMIVDTSNEIGGDGDIPHAGIGDARRMQVPSADMQHKVLIEAVENHMPQVIVIDEIGTKLEAMAASTIAQRGIQLVATAHGVTIENVVMNPLLEMLIGGIQSVTLGDEEASRRGVQKTVLERKGPATFTCGVEIISKNELRVHRSLEATVDCLLSGRSPSFEVRKVTSQGFTYQKLTIAREPLDDISYQNQDEIIVKYLSSDDERGGSNESFSGFAANIPQDSYKDGKLHLYFYGILETSLKQAIKQLGMDDAIELTDNISEAHALLALHSKLKKNAGIQAVSKSRDIPIYVTKTTSLGQIMKALHSITSEESHGFKDKNKFLTEGEDKRNSSEKIDALEEARLAIERVVIAKGKAVELLPRPPEIIALQTDLVKDYRLDWEKVGKQPDLRLRILPLCSGTGERYEETVSTGRKDEDSSDDMNVSGSSLTRLPLLSD